MYIEDIYCYSLFLNNHELEEELAVTMDEYFELVNDLFLLIVNQLKETKKNYINCS